MSNRGDRVIPHGICSLDLISSVLPLSRQWSASETPFRYQRQRESRARRLGASDRLERRRACHVLIPAALHAGFRHIDTAQIYRNEGEIGQCVAASGIPGSEIFLTTKVWVSNYPESRFPGLPGSIDWNRTWRYSISNWMVRTWRRYTRWLRKVAELLISPDLPRCGTARAFDRRPKMCRKRGIRDATCYLWKQSCTEGTISSGRHKLDSSCR